MDQPQNVTLQLQQGSQALLIAFPDPVVYGLNNASADEAVKNLKGN